MRVRATCTLKNRSAGGIISKGTIFEGDEKTLPAFVLSELREKRSTFEILPEALSAKKKRTKKPDTTPPVKMGAKTEPKEPQNKSATKLRKKLTSKFSKVAK